MKRDERGSMVLWMLGVLVGLIVFTGVGVDVWRLIAVQRSVATAADTSAAAGANGIDEQAWRDNEELRLDPGRARDLAADNIARRPDSGDYSDVGIDAQTDHITVSIDMPVNLTMLRFVRSAPFVIHATSTATPRRTP